MKIPQTLSILSVCALSWNCGSIDPDATISLPGSRNPLDRLRIQQSEAASPTSLAGDPSGAFRSGDYVEVIADNAPFFSQYPKSGVTPSSALAIGTALIVLQVDGQNMQVQTADSKVGYVSNLSVGPQGMLVNSGLVPVEEVTEVNWSDMTEAETTAANQLAVDEIEEVELKVDVTPEVELNNAAEVESAVEQVEAAADSVEGTTPPSSVNAQ